MKVWLLALLCGMAGAAETKVLRVCADPNNLPFSNEKREGFENRIAETLAEELGWKLEYYWWAQRRGHVRNTLGARACDLLIGAPVGSDGALLTKPYYESSYSFVTRRSDQLRLADLDAPELRRLVVGVQLIGDDYTNTPPAHLLAARGVVGNIRGYRVTGDYTEPNPPARIVEAVAKGEVDVAIVWGPLAGYFASRQQVPLEVQPLPAEAGTASMPVAFGMAMGVRPGDSEWRDQVQGAIDACREKIVRILGEYGVPLLAKER